MVVHNQLSLDDYVEIMKATTVGVRDTAVALGGIVAVWSVMVATSSVVGSANEGPFSLAHAFPLAVVAAVAAVMFFLPPRQWRHAHREQDVIRHPFQITLETDGVRVTNNDAESLYPWEDIKNVRRTDRFLLLVLSNQSAIPIRADTLTTDQTSNLDALLDHHMIFESPPTVMRRYRIPLTLLGLLGVLLFISGTILDRAG